MKKETKRKYTFECKCCGKFVGIDNITLDHIHPISKAQTGRIYTLEDVQPLCVECNSKKGDKTKEVMTSA